MLDQRRRFHESITPAIIGTWLRHAGFDGYDSSKPIKKQHKTVFEAAANAFESDEIGFSPFQEANVYGKGYVEYCKALRVVSETFGDNALGYVKKLISDNRKLTKVMEFMEQRPEASGTSGIGRETKLWTIVGGRRFIQTTSACICFTKVNVYRLHER